MRNSVSSDRSRHTEAPTDPSSVRGKQPSASVVLEGTRRTLAVLEALAQQGEAPLADLARATGLNRSAAYRILRSLQAAGYAAQNAKTDHYQRGPAFLRLFSAWLSWFEIRNIARPVLEELASAAEETAHFVAYEADRAFYAEKAESDKAVHIASRVGTFLNLHCTAAGKAILAFLPPAERDGVISKEGLLRRTSNTITSRTELMRNLAGVARRGYAVDDREDNLEIRCVGAPVFGRDGKPVGAVSLSAPAYRLSVSRTSDIAPLVCRAAAEITSRCSGVDWEDMLRVARQRQWPPTSTSGRR